MTRPHNRQSSRMSPLARNEAHRTYLEETLFEAAVAAAVMVALADKRACALECTEFARFVEQSRWLRTFTPWDAAEIFDSRVRQVEMTGGADDEMGSLQRVSDSIGSAEIVRAAELVAWADGSMQPAEAAVLSRIQSVLRRSSIDVCN